MNFYFTIFTVIVSFSFLQAAGEISYNGCKLDEFVPQKTSAYISQYDLHIPEMTVREIIDFSARCQGVGTRAGKVPCFLHVIIPWVVVYSYKCKLKLTSISPYADIMREVNRREKEAGIVPDPDVDTYMKVIISW